MSVKEDFEKYDSLIQEKKDIVKSLEDIQEKLLDIKKTSQKDPFAFLQQSNTIDVHHKNQRLLNLRSEEIIKELDEFPRQVQQKLGHAILDYFREKEETERQAAITQENQAMFYKTVKLCIACGGSLVALAGLTTVVATKVLRSRKS